MLFFLDRYSEISTLDSLSSETTFWCFFTFYYLLFWRSSLIFFSFFFCYFFTKEWLSTFFRMISYLFLHMISAWSDLFSLLYMLFVWSWFSRVFLKDWIYVRSEYVPMSSILLLLIECLPVILVSVYYSVFFCLCAHYGPQELLFYFSASWSPAIFA